MRAASKDVREVMQVLRSLGWVLASGNDHTNWSHPEIEQDFALPGTPSDPHWRENVMAKLRRLHENPQIGRANPRSRDARVRRRRRKQDVTGGRAARQFAVAEKPSPDHRAGLVTNSQGRALCPACARVWLSDINPSGRKCPACAHPMDRVPIARAA